jgi:hypothetical protein
MNSKHSPVRVKPGLGHDDWMVVWPGHGAFGGDIIQTHLCLMDAVRLAIELDRLRLTSRYEREEGGQ